VAVWGEGHRTGARRHLHQSDSGVGADAVGARPGGGDWRARDHRLCIDPDGRLARQLAVSARVVSETQQESIRRVRNKLTHASAIAVLTGAGISADSGVPTFRGADGLWRNFRAEDLATPGAFARDPRGVWEWYDWRRGLIATKDPNPAHHALVELERRYEHFCVLTQNVDGLHDVAGSRNLIELHGNIWKLRCTQCSRVHTNRDVPLTLLPYCPECRGLLRPHIVWFGESLNQQDLSRSD